MVEVTPRRIFANGHTYHVNSISVNSDCETYMSADDLRINLWHLAITDRSFSILYCGSLLSVGSVFLQFFKYTFTYQNLCSICNRKCSGTMRKLRGCKNQGILCEK